MPQKPTFQILIRVQLIPLTSRKKEKNLNKKKINKSMKTLLIHSLQSKKINFQVGRPKLFQS